MKLILAALLLLGASAARAAGSPPDIGLRIEQALLDSPAIRDAENQGLGSRVRDFSVELEADGVHLGGKYHLFLFLWPHFSATIGLEWKASNVFAVKVREVHFSIFSVKGLTKTILDSVQKRLDQALDGALAFEYVGEDEDGSQAIRATVNMKKLMPAFPGMSLTGVSTRHGALIMNVARLK